MCLKFKLKSNISTQEIKIRVSLIQETRRDEIQNYQHIRDEPEIEGRETRRDRDRKNEKSSPLIHT